MKKKLPFLNMRLQRYFLNRIQNCMRILFLCVVFFQSMIILAQTTEGKEFWVSYMRNYQSGSGIEYKVIISAKNACTGVLSNPNTGWTKTFSVGSNSRIELDIPRAECYIENSTASNVAKAILIQSTDKISVYAANFARASFDASNILPVSALMDEYIIQTYQGFSTDQGAAMMVIATEDNTEVTITPKVATKDGHAANIAYNKVLQRGEVYYTEATNKNDLSGTQIQ